MIPEELRIGNFVRWKSDGYSDRENKIADKVFRVILVEQFMIKIDIGFGAAQRFEKSPIWSPALDEVKGVPITEEWLFKFGFTLNDAYEKHPMETDFIFRLTVGSYKAVVFYNMYLKWTLTDPVGSHWIAKIQYIHQLQNLYFALTNEELTIKP